MSIVDIFLIGIILIVIIGLVIKISPEKSRLIINRNNLHFPVVSGYNLDRQEFEFPKDFEGELNLVIVPFKQEQQLDVNTWLPTAQELEASIPGFLYYELPTITNLPSLSRAFINEGMRAGIPDQKSRERTITLYLDKDLFKSALGISSEDEISLFLVNPQGDLLWKTEGVFSTEKADNLSSEIKGLLSDK